MKMKNALLWLWQLPQNLFGWLTSVDLGEGVPQSWRGARLTWATIPGGVALGEYIIADGRISARGLDHEYGHVRQSRLLGPLYLIVIGIPSLLHNLLWRWCGRRWDYYRFYTERWADKLGGVKR